MTICLELSTKFRPFDHAKDKDVMAVTFAFFRLIVTTVSIIDIIGGLEEEKLEKEKRR